MNITTIKKSVRESLKGILKPINEPTQKIYNEAGIDVTPISLLAYGYVEKNENNVIDSNKRNSIDKNNFKDQSPFQIDINQDKLDTIGNTNVNELPTQLYDPYEMIEIFLEETDTIYIFDVECNFVDSQGPDAEAVLLQNKKYQELLKSKVGSEVFVEKGFTTFHDLEKDKETQTASFNYKSMLLQYSGSQVFNEDGEDIFSFHELDDGTKLDINDSSTTRNVENEKSLFLPNTIEKMDGQENFYTLDSFHHNLMVLERLLILNIYQKKLAKYFGIEISENEVISARSSDDALPSLSSKMDVLLNSSPVMFFKRKVETAVMQTILWKFRYPMINECNVSCMAWNTANVNLLAIGYCETDFTNQIGGLVCCFSLLNIQYPERIFKHSSGATSLAFSSKRPYLLAVGYYNGSIAVYNVGIRESKPRYDSRYILAHTGPVWQMQWRNVGTEEVLFTCSSDGQIIEWTFKSELNFKLVTTLRHLRVEHSSEVKKSSGDFTIGAYDGGLTFDINNQNNDIFIVGTEDGCIHKCSCLYPNQYIMSYIAHKAPVYQVSWSPFDSSVFASCSADWQVLIWHQDITTPLLVLTPTDMLPTCAAMSFAWSPENASLLALVLENEVQIWDLYVNLLDPIMRWHVDEPEKKFSTILFSNDPKIILVGDNKGNVNVVQLHGISSIDEDMDQSSLLETIFKYILETKAPRKVPDKSCM